MATRYRGQGVRMMVTNSVIGAKVGHLGSGEKLASEYIWRYNIS